MLVPFVLVAAIFAFQCHSRLSKWMFLGGDKIATYKLIHGSFKMPVQETIGKDRQPGYEFIHSNNIMLVDAAGVVRGKFDATKGEAMSALRREIQKLAKGGAEEVKGSGDNVDRHKAHYAWLNAHAKAVPLPTGASREPLASFARLQELLEKAGVLADVEDVAEAFRAAQKDDAPAATVINALFEDEPRFSSPKDARALFGNLFGLWEVLQSGSNIDLKAPTERAKRPPPPARPTYFPKEGPDDGWVEGTWRYLEAAHPKDLEKLHHAYDHRTDWLVTWLDEQGLSGLGFAFAQHLLFELFAMLELGSPKGVSVVDVPVNKDEAGLVPPALAAYAEEAVFEAEHDEEEPLPQEEARRLHSIMGLALGALLKARKE